MKSIDGGAKMTKVQLDDRWGRPSDSGVKNGELIT